MAFSFLHPHRADSAWKLILQYEHHQQSHCSTFQAENNTALRRRSPVKNCGNFTGRMTASFRESFAPSSPATSSHCTITSSL